MKKARENHPSFLLYGFSFPKRKKDGVKERQKETWTETKKRRKTERRKDNTKYKHKDRNHSERME